mgnify:CR=1 FL=1
MKALVLAAGIIPLMIQTESVTAEELPPEGSKQLSEIAKMLEEKGYKPITEVSLDRGVWEIEAYKNNEEIRINGVKLRLPESDIKLIR